MCNPAASSPSDSSCSGGSVCQIGKKSWPPPDAAKEPFLVGDFLIPIDVDLTRIEFATEDDPAFFCIYASDAEIHTALGIPGAPVPQGPTPALSAAAFRAFVVSEFAAVCNAAICSVARLPHGTGNSDSAFQRLSNREATDLTNRQIERYIMWGATVAATVGAATGLVYEMTPSPGGAAGGGRSPQAGGGRSPQAQQTRRLITFAPP
jgi:hypothetical protein